MTAGHVRVVLTWLCSGEMLKNTSFHRVRAKEVFEHSGGVRASQTNWIWGVKRDWTRYGLPSVSAIQVLHADPLKETSNQGTRSVSSSRSECAFLSCARQLPLIFNHSVQIGRESPALLLMLEDSGDTWESFPECRRLAGSNSCVFVPSGSVVSHNSLILSPQPHHLLSHRSRGL